MMRLRQIMVLVRREYLSRVKSKAFWLSTLALPLFMGAIFGVSILANKAPSAQTLAVVDTTGRIAPLLAEEIAGDNETDGGGRIGFDLIFVEAGGDAASRRAELDRQVVAEEIDAWLWVSQETLDRGAVEYHGASVSNFLTQKVLEQGLSTAVRKIRFADAGIDRELVDALSTSVELTTVRVSAKGSREEAGLAGFFLAYILGFLLYMVLVLYGNQVMTGVLEEKSSRVVEVMLATVRPFELMMGKLLGVCLAVLTQIAIWFGTVLTLSAPGLVPALAMVPEGTLPELPISVVVHFFVLFLLGYFVYATFYAAIGAAFNNVQEAQQFASVAVMFIIVPLLMMFPVINDPDSMVSQVTSLIPPFTPILMMLRIAVKTPPVWQIALGYTLTALFGVFMVWFAARIYRVGILMVGKKPTVKEMWRWLRYA